MAGRKHWIGIVTLLAAAGSVEAQVRGDFDGNGKGDLAIGIPNADVWHSGAGEWREDAGSVLVLYGTSTPLRVEQELNQGSSVVSGNPQVEDHFGAALAAGDFNGDGYDDLVVGVPDEDDPLEDQGAIVVLYGGIFGVGTGGSKMWHQGNISGLLAEAGDRFGFSLAVGEFNGDEYDDVAIGVPFEDVVVDNVNQEEAGVVIVMYGSSSGLKSTGNKWISQKLSYMRDQAEDGDRFGYSLAVGTFDKYHHDDLAIGVPREDIGDTLAAGAVSVVYSNASGLGQKDDFWHRGLAAVKGAPDFSDWYGFSVAAGDFNGDGYDDLAAGVPEDDHSGVDDAGSVSVIYSTGERLSANSGYKNDEIWHQDTSGVVGRAEENDNFGWALAAGNFNRSFAVDGNGFCDDLAIGVPYEDREDLGKIDSGGVLVLYGRTTGLSAVDDEWWDQRSDGIKGGAEPYDRMGKVLSVGNFNWDSHADLVIGVPEEGISGLGNAGAVNVIYGSVTKLTSSGNQMFYRGAVVGSPEEDESFGDGLSNGY